MDEYRANYKRMPDGQLLELAEQVDELTEEAQTALRAEIDRRGIAEEAVQESEAPPSESPARAPSGLPEWFLGSKSPALPDSELVAVFSAASGSEAEQVQESLRVAGIDSQTEYVILVPQVQAERAFEVLSEQLGPDDDQGEEEGDEKAEEEEEDDDGKP